MVSPTRLRQAFLVLYIVVVCLAYVTGTSLVFGLIAVISMTISLFVRLWWENPAQPH